MQTRNWVMCLVGVLAGVSMAACDGNHSSDSSAGVEELGSFSLSLVGQGNMGNSYRLVSATFDVVGYAPATIVVSGDETASTISTPLHVGAYTVTLQSGWTLARVSNGSTVTATLASANPQSFVIKGGQTTSINWVFNVSPTGVGTCLDDCEVVSIANGTLSMSLTAKEAGWCNFWTGSEHTCGLLTSGEIKCWGNNVWGQLGYGDTTSRFAPSDATVNVGTGRTVKRVLESTGVNNSTGAFTCGLLDDGTLKCWGFNYYGQLGYGDATNSLQPRDAIVDFGGKQVKTTAIGADFACAIYGDTNAVRCWGNNNTYQLGTTTAGADVDLGPGNAAISVVAGYSHACALLASNQVECWGANSYGELGYGDYSPTPARQVVVDLGAGRTAAYLAAGLWHTCALLDNGLVKCWGLNSDGQLGYGDATLSPAPRATAVSFTDNKKALRITAGYSHTCALLEDQSITCWGSNGYGQLGYGNTISRTSPSTEAVNLGTGHKARRLMAAGYHTCALLTDNGLKCWGQDTTGAFGIGVSAEVRIGDGANEMGDYLPEVLP